MAAITVSAGTIELYQGVEATLKMRIYVKKNFTTSDLESIVKGRIHSSDFYRQVSCTAAAGVVSYPQFTIDSTTDGTPNTSYYIFALYTNAGVFLGYVHKKIRVPPTPTSTTLGALQIFTSLTPISITDAYYNALVALIGAMMRATVDVFGVAKSSYAAAAAGNPIHVENNDPVIRASRVTVDLETYGHNQAGVNAAIIVIGSTPARLRVVRATTISTNTTFHANTIVEIKGDGVFSVNTGITLTLTLDPATNDLRTMASGLGSVRFRNPRMRFGWLAAAGGSNHNWAYDQFEASAIANGGGDLLMNSGAWYLANQLGQSGLAIYGSGNDPDGVTGTRIIIQDLAATSVIGFSGAVKNFQLYNLSIDRLTSTTARCFWARGEDPDSALSSRFGNVSFRAGVAVTSVPLVEWDATAGPSTWESMPNVFDQCCIFPAGGQIGFKCDTTNTNFVFKSHRAWAAGVGSTMFEFASGGWIIFDGNPDWRRIPGGTAIAAPTTTTNRTVTGTTTGASAILTLTAGEFLQNDVGQEAFRSGALNLRIIDLIDSTHATLSEVVDSPFTAQSVDIKYFDDNPTLSDCCINITGSLNGLIIQGGCDEGFNYFIKTSNSTLFGAIYIVGATIQAKIHMAGARTLYLDACTVSSQTFSDEVGVESHIYTRNIIHDSTLLGAYSAYGVISLIKPRNWGVHDGSSIFHEEHDIWSGHPGFTHGARGFDQRGYPLRFINAGVQAGYQGTDNEFSFTFGQYEPYTQTLINTYALGRQNDPDDGNGRAALTGSQTTDDNRYLGLDCNFDISLKTINGGQNPNTITADGMLIPTTRDMLQILNGSGAWIIHGYVSQPYDDGFRPGEIHLLYNGGTATYTFPHESASVALPSPDDEMSGDAVPESFGFWTRDGYDEIMSPGDLFWLERNEALDRWLLRRIGPSPHRKQIIKSAAYTFIRADAGIDILHPAADNNARAYTIPANSSVAFPIGTELHFANEINTVTIPITTDTLMLADTGTTGTRTLAVNGRATAKKITATKWIIWGNGLT